MLGCEEFEITVIVCKSITKIMEQKMLSAGKLTEQELTENKIHTNP